MSSSSESTFNIHSEIRKCRVIQNTALFICLKLQNHVVKMSQLQLDLVDSILCIDNFYYLQVRYKLAPIIWKRLYKDRLHFTGGGANAITLLLGGRGDSLWPSTSLTLIIVTAFVACVHTIMLSKYLISAPLLVHDNNRQ